MQYYFFISDHNTSKVLKKGKEEMICKHCKHKNEDNSNFCYYCGAQLHKNTLVSAPIGDTVTAYSIPTSGIRYFQGIGNPLLQISSLMIRNKESLTDKKIRNYHTNAEVHPLKNGEWFCPECGEKNHPNDRSCRGCGKYK